MFVDKGEKKVTKQLESECECGGGGAGLSPRKQDWQANKSSQSS